MYRLTLAVLLGVLIHVNAKADPPNLDPQLASVAVDRAYIPLGFDSNDRSEVVVSGVLPNTCYRLGPTEYKVDEQQKTITVNQQAYVHMGFCLNVIIPYSQVLKVGLLSQGTYAVLDGTTTKSLGVLPVSQATAPSIDDYLYIPVTDAFVQQDDGKPAKLQLEAKFADRCTVFKEAIINYYADVIVVLPIAKRVGTRCPTEFNRSTIPVDLKEGIHGTYLVHVRAMGGQSVNKLVDFN